MLFARAKQLKCVYFFYTGIGQGYAGNVVGSKELILGVLSALAFLLMIGIICAVIFIKRNRP